VRIKETRGRIDGTSPYLDLDKLYLGVLERAASKNPRKEHVERMRRVIATVVCLRNPLTLFSLAEFLSMTVDDIRNSLHYLHSVVVVPETPGEPVRFFHPSFPDFIADYKRCTDERFLLRVVAHEYFMALRCMKVIRDWDTGTDDESQSCSLSIGDTDTSWYASEYWPSHLRSGTYNDFRGDSELVEELIGFLEDPDLFHDWCDFYGRKGKSIHRAIPLLNSMMEKYKRISGTLSILLLERGAELRQTSDPHMMYRPKGSPLGAVANRKNRIK